MKRKWIIILFLIMPLKTTYAQYYNTSIGIRAGVPVGLSVKHFVGRTDAFEGILASKWGGVVITGLYEQGHWKRGDPGIDWFWGLGAHLGTWQQGFNPYLDETYSGVVAGADGIIGLEYTFDPMPLNLSFDVMPSLNVAGATGWGGINGALSIRYVF